MLKVEAEAKKIVAAAQDEAEKIIRQARQQAAAVQGAAERDAQAKSVKIIEDGIQEAGRRRGDMLAEIDRKAEQLRHVPQEKVEAARALILAALTGR